MHSETATDALSQVVADLAELYPARERQVRQLTALLPAKSPTFLYIHDAYSIDTAKSLLLSTITSLQKLEGARPLDYAYVDSVACFSPRVLYDTILNALLGWTPSWNEGCRTYSPEGKDSRWNDSLDSFIRGLKQVPAILSSRSEESAPSSSKPRGAPTQDHLGWRSSFRAMSSHCVAPSRRSKPRPRHVATRAVSFGTRCPTMPLPWNRSSGYAHA